MFAEIRNDYMFGPAVEGDIAGDDDGLFAGVAIDGWKTGDEDEEGSVIAQVLMSAHGDMIVAWHDNGARMDDGVLGAIEGAKSRLLLAWGEEMAKAVELCTFPDDDKDYCKVFSVPKGWLLGVLWSAELDNGKVGVDLEYFLNNYCWDETWGIYLRAKTEGKLLEEQEQE